MLSKLEKSILGTVFALNEQSSRCISNSSRNVSMREVKQTVFHEFHFNVQTPHIPQPKNK